MGFRDFRDFNLAMLGKQGWRFIKNPHSLVSKVFKARHFPDYSFMDAQIGNNSSFVGGVFGKLSMLLQQKAKNDFVWNKNYTRLNVVIAKARQFLLQWNIAQKNKQPSRYPNLVEGHGKELWVTPQIEYMNISTDATIFSEYNASGLALIARDNHGDLVQARIQYLPGMVSSTMAEVLAIKEALSWIKTKGRIRKHLSIQPLYMAEEDNKAAELPQQPLPRSFESLLGGNHSRKTTWPEVVGMTGEEAKKQIEEESPGISVHLIPQNSFVTMDYRTNRLRLYIDSSGNVALAPKVG
ncbi:hypothetical protein AgCh_005402 [Apium graveolens]